ncbi:uncharacterized protein DEA37_0006683 [Paragonimus westermani]|uniref:histone acetyltransferase n=1 Tax=Paragonimus westermani TaxID=34504 RepID=A0A5J4NMS7_9TREM|nr:uncharacterized protein DEA37_0006683 [Paragonimus westermani]
MLHFLLGFLLSRIEGQPGSPEKPLSELGQLSYESYWRSKVLPFILRLLDRSHDDKEDGALDFVECVATIHEITAATGIDPHDVAATIEQMTTSIQLGANGRPLLHFDRAQLLKLKVKYDARAATWINVDEECLRWSPLVHPQEMDISTEFGDSSQEVHDSINNPTNSSVPSAPSSTRRTRKLSSPSNSADITQPTDVSGSALQPVGLGRRSLRSSLMSQPLDREPSSISAIGQNRFSLRSNPTTSTSNSPVREPNSLPSNSSPSSTTARTATDVFHLREPRTVHCVRLKPPAFSTPTSSSSNTEGTRTHPKSVRGWRGRKTPRRTDPSPCRKGSFFPNGPKPPDPPSPHGGFTAPSASSGLLSAGTRSSRLCRLRSSHSGAPTTSSSDQRTELAEPCVAACMTKVPSSSGLSYSEMQDSPDSKTAASFAHRVNSSLPEPECLSPLRPTLSSSPRTLTEKLLSEQFCVAPSTSSTSPKLPPSLSPPPPTLSLPDTMDSNIADSLVHLSCPPTSPKEFSAPLAPPCLSFYDTNSHLSTVDNPVEPEPKQIAPIPRRISHRSRKSMVTSNRRRRKRRFGVFTTSTESSSLCRGQVLNSFTAYNRVINSSAQVSSKYSRRLIQDIPPTFSHCIPSGPPGNYSAMHVPLRAPLVDFQIGRFVDPDGHFIAHANSCPSLSDVSGCLRGAAFSFPGSQRHRRSFSLSELYTIPNRANVPIVNQHSPSHSPPPLLASPVVVDRLFKPIPVLVPLGAQVNVADTCLERLHASRDSPSPPLLTTVMMDKKNSDDSRDVHSPCECGVDLTCPPVLFPSKTEPQSVDTFSKKIHATRLTKSHRVTSAQPFQFIDSDASSSCSLDTIPMHLDGLNEAEPTVALAATPSSCSASHPTSPMSRQSSEDTAPMRLLTPSPPPLLLLNDSLFSDSFRFTLIDLTGPTTSLHNPEFHLRSLRSSSEPHTSLVQDGHPPPLPLMQHHREKSCPSLLSTSNQWFGMGNYTDSLMNRKLALSEPYSHMMIDLDSVVAKRSHQLLDLPSQSTANATPDSFIDGVPSVDQSEQELKSAVQNSLEPLLPEYAIVRSPGMECAKAVTSVVTPCTEFYVPLREQPIMWNSVIVSTAVFHAETPLDPTLQTFGHHFPPRIESPGIQISLDCSHSLHYLTHEATSPQTLSDPLCVGVSLPDQPCVCVTSLSEPRIVFPEPQFSESNSTLADSSSSSAVSSRLFIQSWSKSSESAPSDIGRSLIAGSVCSPPPTLVNQSIPTSLPDSTGMSVAKIPIQCSTAAPFHSSNYMNFTAALDSVHRSPDVVDNQFRAQFPLTSDQAVAAAPLSEPSDFLTLDLEQLGVSTSCSHSEPACSFELQAHSVPIRCSTTTGIEFFPFSSTVPSANPVAQSAYLSPAPYPSPGQPTSTYLPHPFSPVSTSKFHSPPIHPSVQPYSLASVPVVQQPKQSYIRPVRSRRNSHQMTQLSPHPLSSSVIDSYYSPQKFSSSGSLFQLPSGSTESHCGFQTTSSTLPDYAVLMQSSMLPSMTSDESMQPVRFTQQASSASEPIGVFTTSPTLCCSSSSGLPVIQPSQLPVPSLFYGTHLGESFDSSLEQTAYNAYTMAYGVPLGHQQSIVENVSDSSRLTPFVDQTQCCSLLPPVQSNHASAASCSQFTVPSQPVLPPSDGVFTHIANVMNPAYASEKTLNQTFFLTPNFPQTSIPFNADTTLSLLTSPLTNAILPERSSITHQGFSSPSNLTSATSTFSGFSDTGFPSSTPYVSSLPETSQINATLLPHSPQSVDVLHTDCIDASFRTAPVLGFTCSTPMYQPLLGTPTAAVAALAPSPQQFVLCPPLLICSSGEPYMSEFCTMPNRPNRLHSVLPPIEDCPYSKPPTSIPLYPLVPQPPLSAWSRTDFPPGQSFSRPTPPPPHHVMPT